MRRIGFAFVLCAGSLFAQDATLPSQQIQIPPKPTCVVILPNGSCADLWRQYNSAILQQYVARQREAASAPLQQQIEQLTTLTADQQSQIKSLHDQMEANAAASLQAKADAHTQGVQDGVGYGVGGTLLLVGVIFGIKKLVGGCTLTKKEQAKAASA
jgi:hypothetical protein